MHVNLFNKQLLPIIEPYGFQRFYILLSVVVLLILIAVSALYVQTHQVSVGLKQLETQLVQEQNQLSQFQQLLSQRSPSSDLVRQQDNLHQGVERHQRLLRLLESKQNQPQRSFSRVMLHLTDIDVPELWLSEFRLQQHRSEFFGLTTQPSSVPDWMSRLGLLPYFSGQRFQGLTLEQTENSEFISFHVMSSPEDPQ